MQEGQFSRTAQKVAVRRAAHQLHDHPKVLDDPLALQIIGPQAVEELRSSRRERHGFARSFRALMAARSRYAEDQLAQAVARGVDQYVVLGAGLDTFACRNPHAGLRVFEVDHPDTQAWKHERLHAAGIAIPATLTFVPVNFERQSFAEELRRAGFNDREPAFFSWLGVTMYLTQAAFESTLTFIAAMPAGSGVVFDFAIDRKLLNLGQRIAVEVLANRVAAIGEPFQLYLNPTTLQEELRNLGFRRTEFLDGARLNALYFRDRADGLRIGLGHLMGAWV